MIIPFTTFLPTNLLIILLSLIITDLINLSPAHCASTPQLNAEITTQTAFFTFTPNNDQNLQKISFQSTQDYRMVSVDTDGRIFFLNSLNGIQTNGPFSPCSPSKIITALFMAVQTTYAVIQCKNGALATDHSLLQVPMPGAPINAIKENDMRQINVISYHQPSYKYVGGQNSGYFAVFDVGISEVPNFLSVQLEKITADFQNVQIINEELALACFSNGQVNIFNYIKASVMKNLTGHQGKVVQCIYLAESKIVISAGLDKVILLSNVEDGQSYKQISLQNTPITMLQLSGKPVSPVSRKQVLIALNDMKIYLYDEGLNKLLDQPVYDVGKQVMQLEFMDNNIFAVSYVNSNLVELFCTIYTSYDQSFYRLCKCPDGYYNSQTDSRCLPCPPRCLTCESETFCLTCQANRQTLDKDCACPDQFYESSDTSSGECLPCLSSCFTCTGPTTCTTCLDDTFLPPLCTKCTLKQFFQSSSGSCINCNKNCETCTNSTGCVTCKDPLLASPTCTITCIAGLFFNDASASCLPCLSQCATCTAEGTCTTCLDPLRKLPYCEQCQTGLYLFEKKLSSSASSSTITLLIPLSDQNAAEEQTRCLQCQTQCNSCVNGSSCTICKDAGSQLPSCLTCKVGLYFSSSKSQCTPCASTCLTCTSDTICDSCHDSKRDPASNFCQGNCLSQYFLNPTSKLCQACLPACSSCTNATACLTCTDPLQSPPACVSCTAGQYLDTVQAPYMTCRPCMTQCVSCTNAISCTVCVNAGYSLPDCQQKACAAGLFFNAVSGLCEACQTQCQSCVGSSGNCKICKTTISNSNVQLPAPGCLLPFKCDSSQNKAVCLKCRGDRIDAPDCFCPTGTFDDGQSENCQPCLTICATCSNAFSCNTCQPTQKEVIGPNQVGQCLCNRPLPKYPFDLPNAECATCTTAYPEIAFSEDLRSIVVLFQYRVVFAVTGASIPSNSNCITLLQTETLSKLGNAATPLCYQEKQDDIDVTNIITKIIILLGPSSTIVVGNVLLFNPTVLKEPNCTNFISKFRSNTVKAPAFLRNPTLILSQPTQPVSPCADFQIDIIETEFSGQRAFSSIVWTLKSATPPVNTVILNAKLQLFSQNSSNFLYFKPTDFAPQTTYIFTVTATNFLGRTGSASTTFTTMATTAPSVKIVFSLQQQYFITSALDVNLLLNSVECSTGTVKSVTSDVSIELKVLKQYDLSEVYVAPVNVNLLKISQTNSQQSKFTVPAFTFQPEIAYIFRATATFTFSASSSSVVITDQLLQFSRSPLQIKMPSPSGVAVSSAFSFSAAVTDPDEAPAGSGQSTGTTQQQQQSQSNGISISWNCWNMAAVPVECTGKAGTSLVMQEGLTQSFAANTLAPNAVYRFLFTVEKNRRVAMAEYLFFTTDDTDFSSNFGKINWLPNTDSSDLFINFQDDSAVILKQEQFDSVEQVWLAIIHANKVISIQMLTSPVYHFKQSDYTANWDLSDYLVLYFLPLDLSIRFNLNKPPAFCQMFVSPDTGYSLQTLFTISVSSCQDSHPPLLYSFYYYVDAQQFASDFEASADFALGYPLAIQSSQSSLQTVLPAGPGLTGQVYFLAVVYNNYGGKVAIKPSSTTAVTKVVFEDIISGNIEQPSSNDEQLMMMQKSTPFYSLVNKVYAFSQATLYNKSKTFSQKAQALHFISYELSAYDFFYGSGKVCQKACNGKGSCLDFVSQFPKQVIGKACSCQNTYFLPDCSGLQADNNLYLQVVNSQVTFINLFLNQIDKKDLFGKKLLTQALSRISSLSTMTQSTVLLQSPDSTMSSLNSLQSFLANAVQQVLNYQLTQQIADKDSDFSVHQTELQSQQLRVIYEQDSLTSAADFLDSVQSAFTSHSGFSDSTIDDALPNDLLNRNTALSSVIENAGLLAKLMILSMLPDQVPFKISSKNSNIVVQAELITGARVTSVATIFKGKLALSPFIQSSRRQHLRTLENPTVLNDKHFINIISVKGNAINYNSNNNEINSDLKEGNQKTHYYQTNQKIQDVLLSVRLLETTTTSTSTSVNSNNNKIDVSQTYDIITTVYSKNPYAFDGKFPYPSSRAPVIYVQIARHGEDVATSSLQPEIKHVIAFNGTAALQNQENSNNNNLYWVCLQRDATNQSWTPYTCQNVDITSGNTIYVECTCSKLLPTTIVNDYKKKFQKPEEKKIFNIGFDSTIILLPSLTLIWLVFSLWGCFLDSRQNKERNTVKPSEMFQDIFFDEKQNKEEGIEVKDADLDKELSQGSVISPDSLRKFRKQSTINGKMPDFSKNENTNKTTIIRPTKIEEQSNEDDDKSNSGSNSSRINNKNNNDGDEDETKKDKKPYISQAEINSALSRMKQLQGIESDEENQSNKKSFKSPLKGDNMTLSVARKQSMRFEKQGKFDQRRETQRIVDYQSNSIYQRKKSIRANTIQVSPLQKRKSIFFANNQDIPAQTQFELEDKLTCGQQFLKKLKNYNGFFEPFLIYNQDAPRFFRFSILYMRFLILYIVTGIISLLFGSDIYLLVGLLVSSSIVIHIISFYFKYVVASQYKCFKSTPANRYYIYFLVFALIVICGLAFVKMYYDTNDDQLNYWGSLYIVTVIFNFCIIDFAFSFILPSFECGENSRNNKNVANFEQNPTVQDTKVQQELYSPRPKTENNLDDLNKSEKESPSISAKLKKKPTKKKKTIR